MDIKAEINKFSKVSKNVSFHPSPATSQPPPVTRHPPPVEKTCREADNAGDNVSNEENEFCRSSEAWGSESEKLGNPQEGHNHTQDELARMLYISSPIEPCPVLAMKSRVSTAFYFLHFSMCRTVEYCDKPAIFTTISPSLPSLSFFT